MSIVRHSGAAGDDLDAARLRDERAVQEQADHLISRYFAADKRPTVTPIVLSHWSATKPIPIARRSQLHRALSSSLGVLSPRSKACTLLRSVSGLSTNLRGWRNLHDAYPDGQIIVAIREDAKHLRSGFRTRNWCRLREIWDGPYEGRFWSVFPLDCICSAATSRNAFGNLHLCRALTEADRKRRKDPQRCEHNRNA